MSTLFAIPAAIERSVTFNPPLTDEELEEMCFSTPEAKLERTKEGTIVVNPPTGLATGDGNSEINFQLRGWWTQHRRGRVCESSTGFFLPDGSMLSADAAYIGPARLEGITQKRLARLPHLCPDFVIELLSASDSLNKTQKKMERWLANGAALGWLVDPFKQRVLICEPEAEIRVETGAFPKGSGPVEGFTLNLSDVWNCYRV